MDVWESQSGKRQIWNMAKGQQSDRSIRADCSRGIIGETSERVTEAL